MLDALYEILCRYELNQTKDPHKLSCVLCQYQLIENEISSRYVSKSDGHFRSPLRVGTCKDNWESETSEIRAKRRPLDYVGSKVLELLRRFVKKCVDLQYFR